LAGRRHLRRRNGARSGAFRYQRGEAVEDPGEPELPGVVSQGRRRFRERQKYVASTTLDSVDNWENSTLIKGSLADFVDELRQQDGGSIGVSGSPTLVRSLIGLGLLDELTLMISPVVAGTGRQHLFPVDAPPASFELVSAQPTSSGTVIATYRPAR
jgi:dihydrofolate reductase